MFTQQLPYDLSFEQWQKYFNSLGEKPFRAKQIIQYLYHQQITTVEKMTSFPLKLQYQLNKDFQFQNIIVLHQQSAIDKGTHRLVLQTHDQHLIEMIIIPNSKSSHTLCLSSQIGCSMGCSFCASGQMKWIRDLSIHEILIQYILAQSITTISNLVFMGMGEPLMNEHILTIIERFVSPFYFNLSSRNITMSTIGITEMLPILAQQFPQIRLAWSFHSSMAETREILLPYISKMETLESLIEAFVKYQTLTKKRITLEYVLLPHINDLEKEVIFLKNLKSKLHFLLNLIPYNPHPFSPYQSSSHQKKSRFMDLLSKYQVYYTLRRSFGKDIFAACGQLANELRNTV